MSNDISFGGAFLINYKRAIPNLQESFEKVALAHSGKQVFRDFNGNKDEVLYVLRDSRDYDVAKFIKINEMKFKYMPDVNTKMRLDEDFPKEAVKRLEELKPKVITKMKELTQFVEEHRLRIKSIKDSHKSRVVKTLDALKLQPEVKPVISAKTGVIKFTDEAKDGKIIISPKGEKGLTYVYYKPSNKYDYPSFYSVDKDGNVRRYDTPDEILEFRKKSQEAIKMFVNNAQNNMKK